VKQDTKLVVKTTVGLDLGDDFSQLCFVNGEGEILEESRIRTKREAFTKKFKNLPRMRIALEAGTHSPWVSRLLKEWGHHVLVANPRKLRLIYQNDKKSDRVDAEYLARVARVDERLLAPIEHRGAAAQADLAIIRARDELIPTRTQLINHVRGAVKAVGERLPSCSSHSFYKQIHDQIPQALKPALMPLVITIEHVSEMIDQYDRTLASLAQKKYPETSRLEQVQGVGPLTAVAYLLTLEDPHRFSSSRSVGSFFGLRPKQSDSGQQEPQLRITKAGDEYMRRLLVQAAHYILGPFGMDSDLRRWGLALAQRGGKNAKKRAVVAVARKLAVLLHRLWITGDTYVPLFNDKKRKTRLPASA
jgi:transposase